MKNFPRGHKVQVLHKCVDPSQGNTLAVGKTFVFPTGDAYTVQESGAVVKTNPKPYQNKAERKRYLKARRLEKSA